MSTDGSRPSLVLFQANSHEIRGWIWTKADPSVTTVQWQRLPAVSNQGLTDDWGNISDAYYDDKTGNTFFLLNYRHDRLVIVSADDLTMSSNLSIVDDDHLGSRGSGIVRCGTSLLGFGWQEHTGTPWIDRGASYVKQLKLYSCRTDTSSGGVFNGNTWTQCTANIPPPLWPHPQNGRLLGDTRFPSLKHAFYFPDEHYFWMIKSQDFHQVLADQNANITWKRCGIVNGTVSSGDNSEHPWFTSFITSYQPGGTGPTKYRLYLFGCITMNLVFWEQKVAYGTCISLDETGYVENLTISTDGSPDYVKLPVKNEPGYIVLPDEVDPSDLDHTHMRAVEYGSGGSWAIAVQTPNNFRLFTLDVTANTGYLVNAQKHECKLDDYMMNEDNQAVFLSMAAIPTPRRFRGLGAFAAQDDEGDFDEDDGQ